MNICLICLVFWLWSLGSIFGQIRSDFVLVPRGLDPHITLDAQGNLHVTAWNDDGIVYGLFDSLGNKIKEPIIISNSSVFQQTSRLAVMDTHVIVVWRAIFSFGGDYILGQQLTSSGDTVSSNIRYSEDCCPTLFSPDVTFFTDSTYMVVWTGEGTLTPRFDGVYGQLATTSGKFIGNNQQFSDHAMHGVDHGEVRVLRIFPGEDFIVIWMDDSLGSREVFARLFLADGTPRGPSFLVSDGMESSFPLFDVARDPDGGFAVVWNVKEDTTWQVRWRRFQADGTPRGVSEKVNDSSDTEFSSSPPNITFDSEGKSVVAWVQRENGLWKIMAQRFLAGGTPLGNNFMVSSEEPSLDQFSASVVLHNGKMITAWDTLEDSTTSDFVTWANILDFDNPVASVDSHVGPSPAEYQLFQNYPNPFNSSTRIRFEIANQSRVQLAIYNTLGEKIQTLENEVMLAGSHEVVWNGKNAHGGDAASGLYFVKLRAAGLQRIGKMALVR